MSALSASLVTVGAAIGIAFGASAAFAEPVPAPGTPCGPDKVVTVINTCEAFNSPCSGYDMMMIGRVDHSGHCVVPGLNGTHF